MSLAQVPPQQALAHRGDWGWNAGGAILFDRETDPGVGGLSQEVSLV